MKKVILLLLVIIVPVLSNGCIVNSLPGQGQVETRAGELVEFTVNAIELGATSTWKWYKDNTLVAGANSDEYTLQTSLDDDEGKTYEIRVEESSLATGGMSLEWTVIITEDAPKADAGPDQEGYINLYQNGERNYDEDPIHLDGSGSQGDNLTYTWLIPSKPKATRYARIESAVSEKAEFYAEKIGIYEISLSISGGSTDRVLITLKDPSSPDGDGDILPDVWENEYDSLDSGSIDTDGDGVHDGVDNNDSDDLNNLEEYNIGTDPEKADTDEDGLPDDWEYDEREDGFDPNDPLDGDEDYDGDGLTNAEEYANETFYKIPDSDDDGMLDGWEVRYGLDPLDDDGGLDRDDDDLTNLEEFTSGTDPTLSDTDDDGMPDGWEVRYGLDPLDDDGGLDRDDDGLTNREEFTSGTDPTMPDYDDSDSDGDGVSDYIENLLGTDPSVETDTPGPGSHYEYDAIGRIKRIIRVQ